MSRHAHADGAANYVDVKIHGISNLPATWFVDSGVAPLFNEHPFRYELDVAIAGVTHTFRGGRLLQPVLPYVEAVDAAVLPPPITPLDDDDADATAGAKLYKDVPTPAASKAAAPSQMSPQAPSLTTPMMPPSHGLSAASAAAPTTAGSAVGGRVSGPRASDAGGSAPNSARAGTAQTSAPAVLWVLGAEHDSDLKEDLAARAKEAKQGAAAAASKKGAAAAPAPEVKLPMPAPGAAPLCLARLPLDAAQLAAFGEQVESNIPLVLTFRRLLRTSAPPEWEDLQEARWQAKVRVPLSQLTEPGALTLHVEAPLEGAVPERGEDEKGASGKGPKRGGAGQAVKRARGNVPVLLTEDPLLEHDGHAPHPYQASGTTLSVTLTCFTAVTRLPSSRPRPDLQPSDLIPRRVRPPRRAADATKGFATAVEDLLYRIVADHRAHKKTVAAAGSAPSAEELRASFLQMLQTSGKGHVYRDLLLPCVEGVVRETFMRQPGRLTSEDLERASNELYAYLLDHAHLKLNSVFGSASDAKATLGGLVGGSTPAATAASAITQEPDRWARLAEEAEAMDEPDLAGKYWQQRLASRWAAGSADAAGAGGVVRDEAAPWCDYAEFCLRVRDALKAEQAYREALAIDPTHEGALIGYGALLLSRQRFVEAEVFLQSAVDRHPSALSWGFVSLFFDELHRSLPDSPEEDARRTHCKREAKAALVQAMRLVGVDDLSNPNAASDAVHVLLARRLVALHHEEQANTSLSRVATPSIDVELLYARIFLQTRQYDEALRQCEKVRADAAALAGPARAAVTAAAHTLQADVHAALDQPVEAERNYDAAMRMHPDGATGRTYVHYGNACARLGKYGDALTAFLSAAKLWPCGLAWLGVGIAYYRTGDMVRAEQALNESNILNNLCAKTWAFLALVCLRHRRDADADQAFNQAAKLGLSDAALIAEVGSELQRAGRHGVAEPCLRRALAVRDDSNTRMLLARSLLSLKRLGDARTEFLHVARTTQNDTQRRSAEEQAAAIAALGLADS